MQSRTTDHRFDTALPACAARLDPSLVALTTRLQKPAFKRYLRATLAVVAMSAALSGCGVFCGGAGGSGGAFAGGCATGVRF
jgi:multisubunit Na+/H+ antiporter MnhB subunit